VDQRSRLPRAFALAGVLEPVWFLGGSLVFGALRPGYDMGHAISELGQQGSTYAVVWNIVGFGGQGWAHTVSGLVAFVVTCIIPLVAWRTFLPRAEWRSLAAVSLIVGVVLVGLFFAGPIFFGTTDRVGIWQRLTLVTAGAWQAAVALRLWRLTGSGSGAT